MANSYANNIIDNMNTVTERFIVEHVNASATGNEITVLVYNYGETPISVNVTATLESTEYESTEHDYPIGTDSFQKINLDFTPLLQQGDEVSITVASGRGNNVYYTYFVK